MSDIPPEASGAEEDPALVHQLSLIKKQLAVENTKKHGDHHTRELRDTTAEAQAFRNKAVCFMADTNALTHGQLPLPLVNDDRFEMQQLICARPRAANRIITSELEIAKSTEAYSYRAQARSLYGDLAGAEADLAAAIKISPQPELLGKRGQLFLRLRRYDEAIADFTRAIETGCPPTAYHSRALAYFAKDDYAAAADDLARFFKLNTDKDMAASLHRTKLCKGLNIRGFVLPGCAQTGPKGVKQ